MQLADPPAWEPEAALLVADAMLAEEKRAGRGGVAGIDLRRPADPGPASRPYDRELVDGRRRVQE